MYKLIKESGASSPVALFNTDTSKSFRVGIISHPLLVILKSTEGKSTEDGSLSMSAKWDFEISEETKDEILNLSTPRKGKRIKANEVPEQKPEQSSDAADTNDKPVVNAVDIFLSFCED